MESSKEVVSCENSRVVEDSYKEGKLVKLNEEEVCEERGESSPIQYLQLIALTFNYFYVS